MLKKILIAIGIIFAIAIILGLAFGKTEESDKDQNPPAQQESKSQTTEPEVKQPEKQEETWKEVHYDIAEWDKNDGETKTPKFPIKGDKWRIKWAKRQTTELSIEVYTADDKCVAAVKGTPRPVVDEYPDGTRKEWCEPFHAERSESEGIIDFKGSGTYYVLMQMGTNQSAGSSEIRVEELN